MHYKHTSCLCPSCAVLRYYSYYNLLQLKLLDTLEI